MTPAGVDDSSVASETASAGGASLVGGKEGLSGSRLELLGSIGGCSAENKTLSVVVKSLVDEEVGLSGANFESRATSSGL
jgi:hypothetical protein